MIKGNFSFATMGWMAIASGILSILAIALLLVFFTAGQPFGTLTRPISSIPIGN